MLNQTQPAYALFEIVGSTSQAVMHVQRKIEKYRALQIGWHYGEGVPLQESIIQDIQNLTHYAALFGLDADAFPLITGGCSVAFYSNDDRMEITINPTAQPVVSWEHGKGFNFTEEQPSVLQTLEDAKSCLLKFSGRSWFSSGFFTPSSSILAKSDSLAEPSATPPEAESQLSITFAPQ
jgi:hypothetical protein